MPSAHESDYRSKLSDLTDEFPDLIKGSSEVGHAGTTAPERSLRRVRGDEDDQSAALSRFGSTIG